MLLHALESGVGDDVAVLLHGLMGSAESWHRVAPALVAQGFRVLALDLPGHGRSPRDHEATVATVAESVVETVNTIAPDARLHIIGHSFGGAALAAAAPALQPALAAYVDTVAVFDGDDDRGAVAAQYEIDRRRRTIEGLRSSRPYYSAEDAIVEARAAEDFDPATAASISVMGNSVGLGDGSILVRAKPSNWVTDADAKRLANRGIDIREIDGAAHTIWYSHFDEFCRALPELFARR